MLLLSFDFFLYFIVKGFIKMMTLCVRLIHGPGIMRGLSLLLVLYSAPRGLPLSAPVFSSHQKLTFPNYNSSVDSWFRKFRDPRAWRVYLATGFNFGEKKSTCFGSIGARLCRPPLTLPLCYKVTLRQVAVSLVVIVRVAVSI